MFLHWPRNWADHPTGTDVDIHARLERIEIFHPSGDARIRLVAERSSDRRGGDLHPTAILSRLSATAPHPCQGCVSRTRPPIAAATPAMKAPMSIDKAM